MKLISQQSAEGPSGIERVVKFTCGDDTLIGVCNMTELAPSVGVIIIVGGRQYRIGSHRQFVELARQLAESGIAVFRFDLRGMGDSQGQPRHFNSTQDDINAAADCFRDTIPSLKKYVLWGLCDGATAALQCAVHNDNYSGVVMVNPWISDEISMSTYVKHYYISRLISIDFWKKVFTGNVNILETAVSVLCLSGVTKNTVSSDDRKLQDNRVRENMMESLSSYKGEISIVISESDTTAQEFVQSLRRHAGESCGLTTMLNSLIYVEADHTFSTSEAKQRIGAVTRDCVHSIVQRSSTSHQ